MRSKIVLALSALPLALVVTAHIVEASDRPMFTDEEAVLAATLLSSEGPCELAIDVDGMLNWFDEQIPAGEAAAFAQNMNLHVTAKEFELQQMGATQKRLHCRALGAKLKDAGWLAQ